MARDDAQIKLYVPQDLKDRIKTYAEKNSRSMNAEISRILEREYPAPIPLRTVMGEIVIMLEQLQESSSDDKFVELTELISETFKDIGSGKITGISPAMREAVHQTYLDFMDARSEITTEQYIDLMDKEEKEAFKITLSAAKYVEIDDK